MFGFARLFEKFDGVGDIFGHTDSSFIEVGKINTCLNVAVSTTLIEELQCFELVDFYSQAIEIEVSHAIATI